jgi:hypothetical protein
LFTKKIINTMRYVITSLASLSLLLSGIVASPAFAQTASDYGNGTVAGTYCPQLSQTVQRGSSGNQVLELQKFISDYYDVSPSDIETSYFGRVTQGYVIKFQKEQNLPTYGIAGSLTRAAIARVCNNNVSTQTPGNSTDYNTFATPLTGAAPLTVTFIAPPSAGGDYVYFGDGADGCSIPGVTSDGMTGCSVPSGKPFTHIYTKPGIYKAMVDRLLPSTILATATITVTGSGTPYQSNEVSVSGMQKYTDNNEFGFSFWLPTSWTATLRTAPNMLNGSSYSGGTLKAAWDFSGTVAGRIDEYYSPDRSVSVINGYAAGSPTFYTLYFDTNSHTWMQKTQGAFGPSTAADVSNNTMGGLHIISVPNGLGMVIVPLSARNFLIIHSEGRDYLDGIVKTILATDPAVAVPVDIASQTQIVQTQFNNYVTAVAKCNYLGDVGALTIQNCKQNAVRGQ